jgi:hypothetical protein
MTQNESNKDKDLLDGLEELGTLFRESMTTYENESEAFWNSLSEDERLKVFCAVSRRIHRGEIEDRGSFRYVLYDVFGFGPEAYMVAQDAGFLNIHNAIYTAESETYKDLVKNLDIPKEDFSFRIGDVEDPHLVAQVHLQDKEYYLYRLVPDEGTGGWKCLVYRNENGKDQSNIISN